MLVALTTLWLSAGTAVKLAVLPVQLDASAAALPSRTLDEAVATAVAASSSFEVIGQDDIDALISFEKQKELVGCDDTRCFAEIGGALGVDTILAMRVGFVDGEWVVSSKLIDLKTTSVKQRSTEFVSGDGKALLKAMPRVVAALLGGRVAGGGAPAPAEVERFLAAGLTRTDFQAFTASGTDYATWAERRNRESLGLEITKWAVTLTGLVLMGVGYSWDLGDDGIGPFLAGAALIPPLWIADVVDVGGVPPELPGPQVATAPPARMLSVALAF